MHVELLAYGVIGKDDPYVMGTVSVVNGELHIEGDVPERIKDDIAFERAHTKVSNEALLLKLTKVFSGSYFRARLVR